MKYLKIKFKDLEDYSIWSCKDFRFKCTCVYTSSNVVSFMIGKTCLPYSRWDKDIMNRSTSVLTEAEAFLEMI